MISIQMIFALIVSLCVGGIAGFLGSLMLTKRMSLMGGALGHLTMPGVALAILYNIDVSLGALLFLFFGIILIWLLEQKTQLPIEALTVVVFASSLATTFLFLPEGKALEALIGNISHFSAHVTIFTVIVSFILFFVVRRLFTGLILMSISSDIATSIGINVKRYSLIYLISIAFVVALGVKIVGGLMTAALVAIPACTSKNLSKNLLQYSYISMFLGSLACVLGTLTFLTTNIPAGPLIIIFSSILFLISLFFKK